MEDLSVYSIEELEEAIVPFFVGYKEGEEEAYEIVEELLAEIERRTA